MRYCSSDPVDRPLPVKRLQKAKRYAASALLIASFICRLLPGQQAPGVNRAAVEREAIRLLERGQTEEAEAVLEPVTGLEPVSPRLMSLLGTAQFLNRKYLMAEETLRRAVELGQGDPRTMFYLTSVLWENGDLGRAEEVCRQAMAAHGPQLPLAHILGRLLLWQGRYSEAAEWLEKAVSRSSGSVDLWLDLAGALEGANRLDEALMALNRAVALAPEHYQVRYGLARLLTKSGDRQGADRELANYRRLLEEDQERTLREGRLRAQVDLGYELMRQGEAEAAITHLDSLPLSVEVLVARAAVWQDLGDREAAQVALEQAVALDPGRGDLRAKLAALRLAEGSVE